jgi:outer membrane protein
MIVMKKAQHLTLLVTAVLALIGTTTSMWLALTKPKTAYVNLTRVYNEFELKKQLEQQLTSVQQIRQKTLDSLELGLNMLSRNLQNIDTEKQKQVYLEKAGEFDNRRQEYAYRQKMFSEDNATLTQQYSEQIWKQLNQYVKDYGDANGYEFILGGDGSGTMMYAEAENDITETLVVYTNERFKGESK